MAKMRDTYEDQIWDFFSNSIIPSATKYQINCTYIADDITDVNDKQKFEDILLKAVAGETKSSVSYMYILVAVIHNVILGEILSQDRISQK